MHGAYLQIISLSSFLTMLEAAYQVTLNCHGG